jgi:hypothetical protein
MKDMEDVKKCGAVDDKIAASRDRFANPRVTPGPGR